MRTMKDTMLSVALIAAIAATGSAMAQATRSGGGDARMQQALQQLTTEKAQLQAENAKLKKEAKEAQQLRTDNEKLEKEIEFLRQKAGVTEANNATLTATLDAARSRLDEVVVKYRELATQFRDNEQTLALTSAKLADREDALLSCASSNDELATIALDALDRYENKGFFSKAAEVEPFIGIGKARVANLIDEYSYQVEELRLAEEVTSGIGDVLPAAGPSGN